jgi:hypothetical protein
MPAINPIYRRPLLLALVVVIEFGLVAFFFDKINLVGSTIRSPELFKGFGTVLFGAPAAYLLWMWRNIDKQQELKHDAIRLKNENDKVVHETKILEGNALVSQEKIEKANLERDIETIKGQLALTQQAKASIEDQKKALQRELESKSAENDSARSLATELKQKIVEQDAQLSRDKRRIEKYEGEVAVLKDQVTRAEYGLNASVTFEGFNVNNLSNSKTADASNILAAAPQPAESIPRVVRNDPCPCGSGKKYKRCHGRLV